jgi:histone H3/H4
MTDYSAMTNDVENSSMLKYSRPIDLTSLRQIYLSWFGDDTAGLSRSEIEQKLLIVFGNATKLENILTTFFPIDVTEAEETKHVLTFTTFLSLFRTAKLYHESSTTAHIGRSGRSTAVTDNTESTNVASETLTDEFRYQQIAAVQRLTRATGAALQDGQLRSGGKPYCCSQEAAQSVCDQVESHAQTLLALASRLARHRKSSTVQPADVALALWKRFGISVPGGPRVRSTHRDWLSRTGRSRPGNYI